MKGYLTVLIIAFAITHTIASDAQEGFAVVRSDTIYGHVKINFDAGSVMVKQDSVNRMFINGVQSVTFFNQPRETYYSYMLENKTQFFKVVVPGHDPLMERNGMHYGIVDKGPILIEEKTLFGIFGKKVVKDYAFVRNLDLTKKEDLIELFSYFNNYDYY